MILPFTVPDWLPWWAPTIAIVLGLLWMLAFLLVPFSVIGLKSRLDGLEARLDEIQAEIRTLSLRLPDHVQPIDFDELYAPPQPPQPPEPRRAPIITRPPIPPAVQDLDESESEAEGRRRGERVEPRLGRPR